MNGSDLHDRLTAYLRIREALGLAVGADAKVLQDFVDFTAAHGTTESVTSQVVFEWLDATSKQRLGNAAKRLTLVRQFLLHLSAARPDTQVPECRLIAVRRRPTPFVFTPKETELLLQGATDMAPGTFLSLVIQTALGLIAATGLRASEAVGLDCADVSLQNDQGTLLVRESKFHKSRIVPVHTSTAQHLAGYAEERAHQSNASRTTAFFLSKRGRRLSYELLQQRFREIVERVGIQAHEGGKRPTLHSLRHSFVVSRLRIWHEQGLDVHSRLAHLSTYLGHVDVRDTYWYMTATPELLSAATADFAPPAYIGGQQ